jgi:hypothetical protein
MSSSDCGQTNLPVANLTSTDAGKCPGTAYGNAQINSQISINGSVDLSSIIVGPGGANVQKITYEQHARPARPGTLYVYGQGPSSHGSLKLNFNTVNNETHTVILTSSSPSCHEDVFEDLSAIISINWMFDD